MPRTAARAAAPMLALALVAAACGGDGGEADGGEPTFSAFVGDDPSTLTPSNCTDSECQKVVETLFTGLRDYDPETSEPVDRMLESIESDDNRTWTITIEDGWTFHDGTPVTAQSYVDAWNYAANSENAQRGGYHFERFLGAEALQCETDEAGECVAPPAAEELTGLRAVDDTTIEVELAEPFSQFPLMLGYHVFYPLPEVFFEDPAAFDEQPVGNGQYRMAGPWEHDERIEVERYDDYAGDDAGNAEGIEFQIYADASTAYNDLLAGNLDILDAIPPEQLPNVEDDLGDRFIEREISSFTYLAFPLYDERFQDPRLRQALSLAVDREAIIDAVYEGAYTPAASIVSPVVVGSREDVCDTCEHDPERARELFEAAGGFDGTMTLWYGSGAGHEQWIEAVGNQLRETLGVDVEYRSESFAAYLQRASEQGFDGPFALGWGMDFPSPQNYLEPLYTEAALAPTGTNTTFYTDPEVEERIAEGNAAPTIEEGIDAYQEAEDIILEDMPVVPLWFQLGFVGHSEDVANVELDAFDVVDYAAVEVEG